VHDPQRESWDGNQLEGGWPLQWTGTQVDSDGKSHATLPWARRKDAASPWAAATSMGSMEVPALSRNPRATSDA